MAKSEKIPLRVSFEEKEAFKTAAKAAGLSTSRWMRERLRCCAIRDLENAGVKVPFIEEHPGGKAQAARGKPGAAARRAGKTPA
jgi:hypothetical protein